jgi:carbamoyl-phosphate synthase large subunit
MKEGITIMVTGAGSFCAINVIKSLRLAGNYRIVAVDINSVSAGLYCADVGYVIPKEGPDGKFIQRILEIAKKEKIEAIIPCFDTEIPYFSKARQLFQDEGIWLVMGNERLIELSNDKLATSEFLRKSGMPAPLTFEAGEVEAALKKLSFPVVIKPNNGWGGRLVTLAEDKAEVMRSIDEIKEKGWTPIIQEWIPEGDGEFTVGGVVAEDLEILGIFTMKRDLIKGDSRRMWIDNYPEVSSQAEKIIEFVGSAGPINLQGRLDKGTFKVFEINARFSTTTFVRSLCGFYEVDVMVRNFLRQEKTRLAVNRKASAVAFMEYVLLEEKDFNDFKIKGKMSRKGIVKSVL